MLQKRREGIALVMVIMLVMVTATIAAAAAALGSGSWLLSQYKERQSTLQSVADAGLEEGRARINGNKALYPDSLYNTLENGVSVTDASGNTVPGVTRYTYAGPIGIATGQYGVFGSIVSVAQTSNGDKVIRRLEVMQESFAKYAYFTDVEPSNIAFGGGDQIFGPVHSNDDIQIYNSGATFHGPVETSGTIAGRQYGTFNAGYTERAPRIAMPQTADLNKLRGYAAQGGTAIVGNANGGAAQASTRIEFINIDLNGDGDATDPDEGFMRVYQNNGVLGPEYVTGNIPAAGLRSSLTCGDFHLVGGITTFVSAAAHSSNAVGSDNVLNHDWDWGLRNMPQRGCFLGGDPTITNGFVANPNGGQWRLWGGPVDPRLVALGRPDRNYLFPLSRALNSGFKGVIFVDGKVVISGTLRSRITLASTSAIIIGDDVRYATDPGAGTCSDILGIFAGTDVIIADNALNAPVSVNGSPYLTFDNTADEFIHGVVLALQNFEVQNYASGSTNAQPCGARPWGRGCLFLTGGIIQQTRGAVGTGSGTGYLKRYSYDPCAFSNPPPYFPTTGRFAKARTFEIDPNGFNVLQLYRSLSPAGP